MYQGHHKDGSGVQAHSAGSHYPLVVGVQAGREDKWVVMYPNGHEEFFFDGETAFAWAEHEVRKFNH